MRVFLSYSTPDHVVADDMRRALLACRPGLDVYFAPRRNDAGAYWISRLEDELRQTDAVLLLLGRRVGPWQELEYYDALRRNRQSGRPLIAPILLVDVAPGLPFLEQFHRLSREDHDPASLIELILQALDGADIGDQAPPWRLVNPYRGLLAMETQDAAYFFGREVLTAEILTRIAAQPDHIQALVGNSGVGKSSLAMAGVLAALKSQLWPGDPDHPWPEALDGSPGWPMLVVRPGEWPVKALAQACAGLWLDSPAEIEEEAMKWQRLLMGESSLSALIDAALEQLGLRSGAEAPTRLLLYLDQGEELYTRSDRQEARRFSSLMADAVRRPHLQAMLSLRSDHYGRFQEDSELFRSANKIDVTALGQAEIDRVIRLPAERLGVRFDPPDAVAHIAQAAAREPGAMPMVSDLLADAWLAMAQDVDSAGVLRIPFQIVDISRPLADKAERFLALQRNREDEMRRLFTLKLALVPKEGEIVRRRARRSECSDTQWTLVEAMAGRDWRLVTTGEDGGEPVAEVAHEALLRHWPRAARWLEDSREFLIWKGQFEPECRDWEQASDTDRDRALLTGLRLDAATRWQRERPDDLTAVESAFIAASQRAAIEKKDREQQAALRLARQRSWIQRLSATALVVVAMVALLAIWQGHKARLAEQVAVAEGQKAIAALDEARRQAGLADARRLAMAAETVLDKEIGQTTLAGLLATASLQRSSTLEGQRALRRVLTLTPRDSTPIATPWPFSRVQFSPDGRLVAFSRLRGSTGRPATGEVGVVDKHTWQPQVVHAQAGRSWPVLSADGRWLAVAGYGRRLQVFDQTSKRKVLDVHQDDMFDVVFDAQGKRLFVARTDGTIEVRQAPDWHLTSRLSFPVDGPRRNEVRVAISADGGRLLIYGQSAYRVSSNPWLVPTDGRAPVALGSKRTNLGLFSPAGALVATVSFDNDVSINDAGTGQRRHTFKPEDRVAAMDFSPDGSLLIVATRSGNVLLTDADSGHVRRTLSHTDWVNAVAVSADGVRLATASDDRTAAVWHLETGERLLSVPHDDEVWSVAFDDAAGTLLTGGKDGALRAIDLATGQQRQRLRFDGGVLGIAHAPGASSLALAIRGTEHEQAWTDVVLADTATGAESTRIEHNGHLWNMRFSPDGRSLAVSANALGGSELRVWDTTTGKLKSRPGIRATALSFSADSQRLIGAYSGREAFVLDAADGRRLATIGEPGGVERVHFAPDGHAAITFGQDGSFRGWDAVRGTATWSRPAERPDKVGIVLSGNGRRFADLSADARAIEVVETRTGELLASIPAGERVSYDLSDDGGALLLTRTNLQDVDRPGRRYSEVELWKVDTGQRILARRLEHGMVMFGALSNGAVAIRAMQTLKDEPTKFVEVLDADTGARRWSAEFKGGGFIALDRVARSDDLIVVGSDEVAQLRDLATGRIRGNGAGRQGTAVAVLPGSGRIAFRRGEVIELRDSGTGAVLRRLDGQGRILDVQLSADARRMFVAVDGDKRTGVWVWRTDGPTPARFIEMDNVLRKVSPLADPDLLATYDNGDTLRVWRLSTGKEVHRLSHTATASGVAVASAADRAVTWRGASLRVWNTRDGSQLAHRLSHGPVTQLAVSPDGNIVAYLTDRPRTGRRGGDFKALVLWEHEAVEEPAILPMASPRRLRFDPTGRRLAVVSGVPETVVQLFDVATLRSGPSVPSLPGSKIRDFNFSVDGALLLVAEQARQEHALRVFRADSGIEIARIDGHADLSPAPPGPKVAVRVDERRWHAVDVESATPDELLWRGQGAKIRFDHVVGRLVVRSEAPATLELPKLPPENLSLAPLVDGTPLNVWAVDADGGRLAALTDAGIAVHAADDGRRLADWPGVQLHGGGMSVGPHRRGVRDLMFADRGKTLVAFDTRDYGLADMASRLWLWRWQQGAPQLLSDRAPINMVAVSPAGDLFATAEGHVRQDERTRERSVPVGEARVRLWNARTGQEIRRIALDRVADAVTFSPDGANLAVRTGNNLVIVSVADGTQTRRFEIAGRQVAAGSVRFALGGHRILGETDDGVQMWSLEDATGMLLRHGSDWPFYRLSADGRLLVSFDQTRLRVWDVATGAAMFELEYANRKYGDMAFVGPDDALIARTPDGLEQVLWQTERLIAEACRRFDHEITVDEWNRFIQSGPPDAICMPARR